MLPSGRGLVVIEPRGEEFSKELSDKGVENTFLEPDVTNEEAVKTVVEKAVAKYGKLDALVNMSIRINAIAPGATFSIRQ